MPHLTDELHPSDHPEPAEPVADEAGHGYEYALVDEVVGEVVGEDDDALTEPVVVEGDRVTTDGGPLDRALVTAFLKPAARGKRGDRAGKGLAVRRRRVLVPPKKKAIEPIRRLRAFVPRESAGRVFLHAMGALVAAGLVAVAVAGLAPATGRMGWLEGVAGALAPFISAASAAVLVIGVFLAARVVGGAFLAALAALTLAGAATLVDHAVAGSERLPGLAFATLGVGLTLGWWRSGNLLLGVLAGLGVGFATAVDERAVAAAVPLALAVILSWQWRRPLASLWRVMLPPLAAGGSYIATLALAGRSLAFDWRPAWVDGLESLEFADAILLLVGALGGLTMLARRPRLGVALLAWAAASFVAWQGALLALLPPALVGATYALWRVLSAPGGGRVGTAGVRTEVVVGVDGLWRQATVPLVAGVLVAAWLWFGLRAAPLAEAAERRLGEAALTRFVAEGVPKDATLQLDPPGDVVLPAHVVSRAAEGEGPLYVLTTELGRRMLESDLRIITPSPTARVVGRFQDAATGLDWVLVRVE